jgi:peptidoglycan/LPS O-acetylase OafA/YrhL
VEGLRALACLTVVVNHAIAESFPSAYDVSIPNSIEFLRLWFAFGHHAVTAFIVISGFCLGIPLASRQFRDGISWNTFMLRRLSRILPPYYAALVISLIVAFVCFKYPAGIHYDFSAHPRLSDIAAHFLLVHNVIGTGQINYSLWSIATEIHIYCAYPVLVWCLSKKNGWVFSSIAVAVFYALSYLLVDTRISRAYVHLAGAFIVGVGASWVVTTCNQNIEKLKRSSLFPILSMLGLAAVVVWTFLLPRELYKAYILPHDFIVMVSTAALLVWCSGEQSLAKGVMEFPPLVWIGERSYSLYLLHVPIQAALLKVAISTLDLTHTERLVFSLTFGLGILLGLTWIFHRVVEIPAMALSRRVSQLKQATA